MSLVEISLRGKGIEDRFVLDISPNIGKIKETPTPSKIEEMKLANGTKIISFQ